MSSHTASSKPFGRAAATAVLEGLGRLSIGWVCLLCFGLRMLYLWWTRPAPGRSNYWIAADALVEGGWTSTFLEPAYVVFLAAARRLGGDSLTLVLTLQVLLATAGCYALYRLALAWCGQRASAALVCLLYAVHPYLIRQSVALIYLPLLIPLLILCLRYGVEIPKTSAAVLFGFTAGLTLLTRADFAVPLALLLLWTLWRGKSRALATALATTALVVAPGVVRNWTADGSILPTRAGFDLLKGNCEYSDRLLPDHSLDLLNDYIHGLLLREAPELASAGTREKDRFYFGKAWEFIREHPLRTLRLKALNLLYLYSPRLVPTHPLGRETRLEIEGEDWKVVGAAQRDAWREAVHLGFSGLIMLGAAGGLFLRRRSARDTPLFLTLAGYTAVYSIFWPATRLRASYEFVLILYAGWFFCRILQRLAQDRSPGPG